MGEERNKTPCIESAEWIHWFSFATKIYQTEAYLIQMKIVICVSADYGSVNYRATKNLQLLKLQLQGQICSRNRDFGGSEMFAW